jgi:hypothetical protein
MNSELNDLANPNQLDLIAERVLVAASSSGSIEVKVRFGKPMPDPKGDWACPFQIIGIGSEEILKIYGIDAVQALQLAMFSAGADLERFQKAVKISFLDDADLGFPRNTREATGSCPYCNPGEPSC